MVESAAPEIFQNVMVAECYRRRPRNTKTIGVTVPRIDRSRGRIDDLHFYVCICSCL